MTDKQLKNIVLKIMSPLSKLIAVKSNRVVLKSAEGNRYECNPKYITEYLVKTYPGKFEIIWRFNNPEKYKFLEDRGIKVCKKNSIKDWYYMFSAKFLIDNHNIMENFPKKKNQVIINTWHGGGSYKCLRGEANDESVTEFIHNDKFISSCARQTKKRIMGRFNLPYEQVLECGTPRNDILFTDFSETAKKVKEQLNIPENKKVILYVPTYRDYHTNDSIVLDVKRLISACEKRFGGDYVFLSRAHHFSNDIYKAADDDSAIVNVNDFDDMQELICACDIFITDYSSVMWDISFTDKPCFIYAYDLKDYLVEWKFFTPIEEWPYPVSQTIDELESDILNFDNEDYRSKVEKHHNELGSFETGNACKSVAEYMLSKM
ncbi:MAG: CDP-glycerol glycerophosphotransferase family protein [Eubacterium sp.]